MSKVIPVQMRVRDLKDKLVDKPDDALVFVDEINQCTNKAYDIVWEHSTDGTPDTVTIGG